MIIKDDRHSGTGSGVINSAGIQVQVRVEGRHDQLDQKTGNRKETGVNEP